MHDAWTVQVAGGARPEAAAALVGDSVSAGDSTARAQDAGLGASAPLPDGADASHVIQARLDSALLAELSTPPTPPTGGESGGVPLVVPLALVLAVLLVVLYRVAVAALGASGPGPGHGAHRRPPPETGADALARPEPSEGRPRRRTPPPPKPIVLPPHVAALLAKMDDPARQRAAPRPPSAAEMPPPPAGGRGLDVLIDE